MDRLAALEAFVKVAETQSFSEAAARLGASKSVLSRQVSGLEAELGARLFHRTTRSLTLTDVGRGYLEKVTQVLADLAQADESVTALQASPRGRLKVNAPMSFGFLHLAPALPDLLARCPELEIDVTMNDRFVDLVDEGFDVAVRIGALPDSSLVVRRLAPIRRVVCASPAYLAAHGTPQTPQGLEAHQCLLNTNLAPGREWSFVDANGKPLAARIGGRLRMNSGDALRAAALQGVGLTELPTFIVGRDLQSGALVSVLNEYVPQTLALHAVYPHARHLSPKVRVFIDYLAERFGPRPYWDLVE